MENRMFPSVDFSNYDEKILRPSGLILINFWAFWNHECLDMLELMHKCAGLLKERVSIVQVDWDKQKQLGRDLEVFGVPTLLICSRGQEIARFSGVMGGGELLKQLLEVMNHAGRPVENRGEKGSIPRLIKKGG